MQQQWPHVVESNAAISLEQFSKMTHPRVKMCDRWTRPNELPSNRAVDPILGGSEKDRLTPPSFRHRYYGSVDFCGFVLFVGQICHAAETAIGRDSRKRRLARTPANFLRQCCKSKDTAVGHACGTRRTHHQYNHDCCCCCCCCCCRCRCCRS